MKKTGQDPIPPKSFGEARIKLDFSRPAENSMEVVMRDPKHKSLASAPNLTKAAIPKYKNWRINSGSAEKSSTLAKSVWQKKKDVKGASLENTNRTFSLNSKNREKDLRFSHAFSGNESVSDSLSKGVPKGVQVRVKDAGGKLVHGINVPGEKKKKKKKLLYWKIGDMIIYRHKEQGSASEKKGYIPIRYDVYNTKQDIDRFKKENEIDSF